MFMFPASYTTVDNVIEAMPAIGSVTNITSAVIAQYIGRGEAFINAKLSRQYALPITSSVPLLQTLSLDLALYSIMAKRLYVGDQTSKTKSPWPDRYKEIISVLNEIAEGKLPLLGVDGVEIAAAENGVGQVWSSTEDYLPTMTEDDVNLSFVDSYKIDVIRGERE